MKLTKSFALAMGLTMVAAVFAGCDDSSASKTETTTTTTTTTAGTTATTAATTAITAPPAGNTDVNPVVAADGEAYLALTDKDVWIQYWGKDDKPLCYDAGVAKITGNGSYTVSVDATTAAFHQDTETGDDYKCSGIAFMAIMINDGTNLYGTDMVMTVDSILVDGKEVELTKKNYTSADDPKKERRTNIYNGYMKATDLPEDAISTEGPLYVDGKLASYASSYSPHIIDPESDAFKQWSKIEVNFTVSGMDKDKAADDGATTTAAAGDASTETTTTK